MCNLCEMFFFFMMFSVNDQFDSGFISGGFVSFCPSVLICLSDVCEWPVLSPVGVVVTGLSEVL